VHPATHLDWARSVEGKHGWSNRVNFAGGCLDVRHSVMGQLRRHNVEEEVHVQEHATVGLHLPHIEETQWSTHHTKATEAFKRNSILSTHPNNSSRTMYHAVYKHSIAHHPNSASCSMRTLFETTKHGPVGGCTAQSCRCHRTGCSRCRAPAVRRVGAQDCAITNMLGDYADKRRQQKGSTADKRYARRRGGGVKQAPKQWASPRALLHSPPMGPVHFGS
jgi:hypothetical protein